MNPRHKDCLQLHVGDYGVERPVHDAGVLVPICAAKDRRIKKNARIYDYSVFDLDQICPISALVAVAQSLDPDERATCRGQENVGMPCRLLIESAGMQRRHSRRVSETEVFDAASRAYHRAVARP